MLLSVRKGISGFLFCIIDDPKMTYNFGVLRLNLAIEAYKGEFGPIYFVRSFTTELVANGRTKETQLN